MNYLQENSMNYIQEMLENSALLATKILNISCMYFLFYLFIDNSIGANGIRVLSKCLSDYLLVDIETLNLACIFFSLYFYICLDTDLDCYSFCDLCRAIEKKAIPNLQYLNIEGNNIQNTGLVSLANCFSVVKPKLNYINFNRIFFYFIYFLDNSLTDDAFIVFLQKLERETKESVKILHVYNSSITSESLRVLSSQFTNHFFTNIQVLNLGGNELSFSGFRNLFESIIEGNIYLRELYLSSMYYNILCF